MTVTIGVALLIAYLLCRSWWLQDELRRTRAAAPAGEGDWEGGWIGDCVFLVLFLALVVGLSLLLIIGMRPRDGR